MAWRDGAVAAHGGVHRDHAGAAARLIWTGRWKRQLPEGASELFTRGKKTKDKEEGQAKEAELFQQIGRLQMELEWLKKNLCCSDARDLRKLVDHDHPELSVSRQCALLGLPRSTLYYRPIPVRESTLLHVQFAVKTGLTRSWRHPPGMLAKQRLGDRFREMECHP